MVPNCGSGSAANFSCSRVKTLFARSSLRRPGAPEPDPPRASVKCGLKGRFSFGTPSVFVISSTLVARLASGGAPSITHPKTQAAFGVGENAKPPQPDPQTS